jgi:hypothetical protein
MTTPTTTDDTIHDEDRDPGHLLTIAEWEQVVQEAENITRRAALAERLTAGQSAFPSVTGTITARWGGGSQAVRYGVLHDAETPLANGYALSISRMFSTTGTEKSAHFMVGPEAAYQLRDTSLLAWHCGNGNRYSIGVEQAGYAAFSRAQWLTAEGMAQINRLAALMRDIKNVHGIGTYFMSDAQLLQAYHGQIVGGWATHDQCRRVLGGTSHTDPMPNYPFDVLGQAIGGGSTPPPNPPPPSPTTIPPRFSWPYSGKNHFGNIAGDNYSHGGYSVQERAWVKSIQQWFIYRGCVPGITNWQSGWADGKWENATDDACIRWHARYYPGQPKPKEIWSDDYARLVA